MANNGLVSIDKAFEWLAVLETVLAGVTLGYGAWLTTPEKNLTFMSDTLFVLSFPIALAALLWFFRYLTVGNFRKSVLSMYSWSFLTTIFLVNVIMLLAFVLFGNQVNLLLASIAAIFIAEIIGAVFPYKKIIEINAESCVENPNINDVRFSLGLFFISGLFASALLIILPYAILPVR